MSYTTLNTTNTFD